MVEDTINAGINLINTITYYNNSATNNIILLAGVGLNFHDESTCLKDPSDQYKDSSPKINRTVANRFGTGNINLLHQKIS